MSILNRLKGGAALPPKPSLKIITWAAAGAFLAIAVLALIAQQTGLALMMGSFGASCIMVFGFADAPFAQPRNVIAGHFLSSLTGLIFLHLVGTQWWSMALAVAIAIAVMMATRTTHPPAASNPGII